MPRARQLRERVAFDQREAVTDSLGSVEGDFVQLQDSGQSSPMSMTEVGQLAADITCAIKSNMPNAVVQSDARFMLRISC